MIFCHLGKEEVAKVSRARRAYVEIKYNNLKVTRSIENELLDFSYTDNASGSADSIALSVEDRKGDWGCLWLPESKDIIQASIITEDFLPGKMKRLNCGTFYVDEPSLSGPPRIFSLGAISTPINSSFKDVKITKLWKQTTLENIVSEIAKANGLGFSIFADGISYKLIEQTETPDSAFLSELCDKEGLSLKVTDQKLVVFDKSKFEKNKAIWTYEEGKSDIVSYSFTKTGGVYNGCKIKYLDKSSGKTLEYLLQLTDGEKIYSLNEKVDDLDEAIRRCKAKLSELNKNAISGSLSVMGNPLLLASNCVMVKGFGGYDGKYYIESAAHSLPNYTTSINIRKVGG